jgi:hypothetical protein
LLFMAMITAERDRTPAIAFVGLSIILTIMSLIYAVWRQSG